MSDFREIAQRWLGAEPDEDMRAELRTLLEGSDAALTERFTGRLQFGTAGLRAAVGAGPQRMNRLVVRQAAAGLAEYLLRHVPGAAEQGVIIDDQEAYRGLSHALDSPFGQRQSNRDTCPPT